MAKALNLNDKLRALYFHEVEIMSWFAAISVLTVVAIFITSW